MEGTDVNNTAAVEEQQQQQVSDPIPVSNDAQDGGEASPSSASPRDPISNADEPEGEVEKTPGDEEEEAVAETEPVDETVLVPRFFPNGNHNPGFSVPPYLVSEAAARELQAPADGVVLSWDARLAQLTEDERNAFTEFRAAVAERGWLEDEAIAKAVIVDDWALLRFLAARQFKIKKALPFFEEHIEWARQVKPRQQTSCQWCIRDPHSHWMHFCGWDKGYRPVLMCSYRICPERHNLEAVHEHNISMFTHAEAMMPPGVEQWVNITDFVGYSHWADGTSSVGRKVVEMLQNHYPERLHEQILVDPPTAFWVFWKALTPFIDAKTQKKVLFVYTDGKPNLRTEFEKRFPAPVAEFLIRAFTENKSKKPYKKPKEPSS